MRGVLIKMGAGIKRKRGQRIRDLISKIHALEAQNKRSASPVLSDQLSHLGYDLRLILMDNFEIASKRLKMVYYFSYSGCV